ncbi:MAG: hypothetical protein CVU44_01285 [Chloroflexi bacterium HGW-Chloroflexi-6]|nr:MAG: hypothetical protein CVU44_01285 [Chloroflexi bacterium HGW-Chloroflexi-6]
MTHRGLRPSFVFFTLLCISLFLFSWVAPQEVVYASAYTANKAEEETPPGPDRFTTIQVKVTIYEWWLTAWEDNEVHCQAFIEHDGMPTHNEVYDICGSTLYDEWIKKSQSCNFEEYWLCKGFYWQVVGDKTIQRDLVVPLPDAQIWVSLESCEEDETGWCTSESPRLVLTAEEPLPDQSITRIEGMVGTDAFTCDGARCDFLLDATSPQGIKLVFWAYSTFGDTSPAYEAVVRVIRTDDSQRLVQKRFVDVLSTQWIGKPNATCSIAWQSFPPPEGLPTWLSTPATPEGLQSDVSYVYLAGNLIKQGAVNVEACVDGGVYPDGTATACGLDAATLVVSDWQNRFDTLIFDVARKGEVPAQLLKNLFSRESQFWPGVFELRDDIGLGQLTEHGADTTLMWNPAFYDEFCPLVLGAIECASVGYSNLSNANQALLRGALLQSVNATCADCPLGIDLARADYSVDIFARTLLANCEQTGKVVQNVTGKPAGESVSYEDLWRLTLLNYNAGAGCLADAVQAAQANNLELTWKNVADSLLPGCKPAADYVEDISQ